MRAKLTYPNEGRLRPSVWGVSVAVLAVVMAVALVEVYLDGYTYDRFRAQILLLSIEEHAAEQAIAEYEAIGEGEVTPEIAGGVAENRRELAEMLDELGRLNPGDEGLARVGEELDAYEAAVNEELGLIEAGRLDEAETVDEERVDPGFEALQEVVEDTSTRYEAEARRADLVVDAATYGTALLAAAMLAVVARLWQREQARRSEQEALRRSEERFRSLAQNSSDVVTVVDADRNVLYQSPSIEKVLGHDPEGRVGKNLAEHSIVHPDDAAEQDAALARAVANPGKGVVAETRMRHRDGSWRWMEVTYTSLLDDPRVGGVVLNARDTTERKRAEEELKESEERYRAVVEQAGEGTFLFDPRTKRILEANLAFQQMFGHAPEELAQKTLYDLVPHDPGSIDWNVERTLEQGHVLIGERQYRHKDGSLVDVEVSGSVISYGGEEVICAVVRDIADIKRAEELLRQQTAALTGSIDGMALLDRSGTYVYVNEAHARIYGYDDAEELLSTTWASFYDEEQLERFGRTTTPMLEKDGHWRGEAIGTRRDGSRFPQEVSVTAVEGSGFVCVVRDVTERKRAEEELRRRQESLSAAQRIARLGSWEFYPDTDETRWSDELYRIFGFEPRQFVPDRRTHLGLVHPEDRNFVVGNTFGGAGREDSYARSLEYRIVRPDGEVRFLHSRREVSFDEASRPIRITGTAQDVTERKRAEEELARLASFPELNPSPVIEVSPDGEVIYANRAAEGLFPGLRTAGLAHPVLADLAEALPELLRSDRKQLTGEAEFGGAFYHLEAYVPPGTEGLVRLYATDITERKALEQKFAYRAFHDDLTGLPNRALFLERLGQALARTEHRENRVVAVLFMDLDNFKYVNDSLTHETGDELLVRVAERLKGCVSPGDTVARFGGDEFTVLLEDSGPGEASALAERIAEELKAPFGLDGREVGVTFSIGIALDGPARERPADLLRNADLAMYAAKAQGKNTHKTFEAEMGARVAERLRLENELRRAVELGGEEFVVHYQPKVELATGTVVGFEALVRWEHPERGTVSPAEFVPLAEETGLIVPLGRRVLEEACRQAKRWHDERPQDPPTKIGVNLSAREFQRSDLADSVTEVLEKTGLEPRSLDLEITESLAMEDTDRTVDALRALKELGVELSIDDFGTGHSSLSYLRRFPVDNLKMDKTFVDTLGHSREDTALVSTTIELAHVFGLEVVAEGVETADQLERLRQLGCDVAQGYYFSKPLPVEAASALLAAEPGPPPTGGAPPPTRFKSVPY